MMMGPDDGADGFQRDTICAKLIGNIMFNFQDRLGRFDLVEDLQCQPQSAYMKGYHVRHRFTSPEMRLEIAMQAYSLVAAFLSNLFSVRGQKEPFHCYSCFRSRSCSTVYWGCHGREWGFWKHRLLVRMFALRELLTRPPSSPCILEG